ncbi:MAG TPA: hypothetical protein VKH44_13475 [Pirellulaceae bacterium]|nr:hypothetical protein [Pirellulaceae bacterium]
MEKLVRKYQAKRDDTGNIEALYLYEYVAGPGTLDSSSAADGGPKILKTADGKKVRRIDTGKYEVLANPPYRITSDDPNAV